MQLIKLVDGYLALKLKSKHLECLAVGMSTDVSHRVLSATEEFYRM